MPEAKERARVLIFTGDGKGKTTAAVGMAVRAAGHGYEVLVLQFMKCDDSTGEIASLRKLPGVTIEQRGRGFVPPPESPKFPEHREAARAALREAAEAIASGRYRTIVLDEVCCAVSKGLLAEADTIEAVGKAPADLTLVLTGRGATAGLIAAADTVTEMRCIKHGYQAGRRAQEGVEF